MKLPNLVKIIGLGMILITLSIGMLINHDLMKETIEQMVMQGSCANNIESFRNVSFYFQFINFIYCFILAIVGMLMVLISLFYIDKKRTIEKESKNKNEREKDEKEKIESEGMKNK